VPNKPYKEMNAEEKIAAFDKLMAGRESRKGQGTAKRTAVRQLIDLHTAEYNKLLKAAGGKPKEVA